MTRRNMRIAELLRWFALAVVVRAIGVWFWWTARLSVGDGHEYVAVARNLITHHVFGNVAGVPSAVRPPLYPALIALLWTGSEPPFLQLMVIQVLLGAATVACVFLMARDHCGNRVARMAAVLLVFAPMTSRYTALVMSETLFTALVVFGLWLWSERRPIGAGCLFGLGALTHGILPFFVATLLVMPLMPFWRNRLREHALIALVFALTLAPWSIRNAIVFHRFILVNEGWFGGHLALGTVDTPHGSGNIFIAFDDPVVAVPTGTGLAEANDIALQRAIARIVADPAHWLMVRARQYPRLFADSGEYLDFHNAALNVIRKWIFLVGNMALVICAAVGCYRMRAVLAETPYLWLLPLVILGIHLPAWVEARRLLPATPSLMILAAQGLLTFRAPHPAPHPRDLNPGHV